ncbi:MAG: hypothetical protein EHM72_06300 [Calditrichaeota bacterium]|nr:MAG: hypothetical protein EHM72_06300 [Calditrichota bacterium]
MRCSADEVWLFLLKRFAVLYFLSTGFGQSAHGMEWDHRLQASLWSSANLKSIHTLQSGARLLPEVGISTTMSGGSSLQALLCGNLNGGYSAAQNEWFSDIQAYRAWLRYSTHWLEVRAGLQQIEFGPALLLRSLMWFERIDPRDPAKFATGVVSVLGRLYFLSNVEIWLWGVRGEGEKKGIEVYPTAERSTEFGGRLQIPMSRGEVAFSADKRKAAPLQPVLSSAPSFDAAHDEIRIAFDGKWDIQIGFWCEAVMVQSLQKIRVADQQTFLTLGADYTFALGNGLHLLGEWMRMDVSGSELSAGQTGQFSALSADYPINLLDSIMAICFFHHQSKKFFQFYTWRRTLDHWSFHLLGFWNPNNLDSFLWSDESFAFNGGKGIQVMVMVNY